MSRFKFPLDPLLKARRAHEQQRQVAVASIQQERQALEDRLRTRQVQIANGRELLQRNLIGKIDAHSLRMHATSSIHNVREAQRTVLELAGVHRRLEAARAALMEASRHRRAIELLRERRFDQWKGAMEKLEDAALDELAVIAAARKLPGEVL